MRGKSLHFVILFFFLLSPLLASASGMGFVQNRGQWDADILYRTEIPGGFLYLKKQSLQYVFYDGSKMASLHAKPLKNNVAKAAAKESYQIKAHGVALNFENASTTISAVPKSVLETRYNYFIGNQPEKWQGDIQAFEEVVYQNLYPGIDLRIYWHRFALKYEFVVQAGADPSAIRLKYTGADQVSLSESGRIKIKTSISEFEEEKPYSFQTLKNNTIDVPSKFVLDNQNTFHFQFPNGYNKADKLTIDPELIFSTYSGSVADNWGHTATYDDAGNMYSAGTVFGTNFPVVTGSYQISFAGQVDVAILKFNPEGSDLLYATYLGGGSTDIPVSLIVNKNNELVILGTTSSSNFPVHTAAWQKKFGGGTEIEPLSGLPLDNGSDIFISKLDATGKRLVGSTYLGGSGNDGISSVQDVFIKNYGDCFRGEVIVDKDDNILIVSSTDSKNFPLKGTSATKQAGRQDGIVARLNSGLDQLLWSTYLGGNQFDAAFGIKQTDEGDVYVTGITQSSDLPVHNGAYQKEIGGAEDAYIGHFKNDKLIGMTYVGTPEADGAYMIDLDKDFNVYVYGLTNGHYPVSSGVYSNENSGQFVHKLSANLSTSLISTVIGSGRGTPDISPTAFLVNECGNIYLAGWGGSVNSTTGNNPASSTIGLRVTADAIQKTTNGSNFYIAILEEGAKSLLYATFFGSSDRSGNVQGDHVDGGTSRFSKDGMIYHATCACGGSRFPATAQAWSRTNRSPNCNNAAFKIDIDRLKADFDVYEGSNKDVTKGCAPLNLTFTNMSEGGIDYIWEVNGSTISREEAEAEYIFRTPGTYKVTLKAYNRLSCKRIDIAEKTIVVESINAVVTADTLVCENTLVQLNASGGTSYLWTPSNGISNPAIANPTVNVKETSEYTVQISNSVGCKVSRTVKIAVAKKRDFNIAPEMNACPGVEVILSAESNAGSFYWYKDGVVVDSSGKSITIKPDETTTYIIQANYEDGCRPVREVTVKVDDSFAPAFDISVTGGDCNGPNRYSLINKTTNAQRYEWDLGNGAKPTSKDVENYIFEEAGEYPVTLTSYNAQGCSLSVTKILKADPPFYMANVITPNGDGKNDYLEVPIAHSKLEIYNRWGKLIYKSGDYQNDWGKGIKNGSYYYVVDTPLGHHCKGWFEVLQ